MTMREYISFWNQTATSNGAIIISLFGYKRTYRITPSHCNLEKCLIKKKNDNLYYIQFEFSLDSHTPVPLFTINSHIGLIRRNEMVAYI